MKKLLVLALVLAMASIASAVVTYQISAPLVDTNVTYTVVNGQLIGTGTAAAAYDSTVMKTDGVGVLTPVAGGYTTAAAVGAVTDMWADYGMMAVSSQSVGDTVQAINQAWFVFDISGMLAGQTMSLAAANAATGYTPGTPVVISAIPEPMTIALLGLGGLFLRRRK